MTPAAPGGSTAPVPYIRQRSSSEKRGRPRKDDGSFVMSLEKAVKESVGKIVATHASISNMIGDRKYGERKISEQDQVRRYGYVRDNQEMWASLIEQHGMKRTVEFAERMEALAKKHPVDMQYGEDAAAGEKKRQALGL